MISPFSFPLKKEFKSLISLGLIIYAYCAFEWMFFLTKPSHFSTLGKIDLFYLILIPPFLIGACAALMNLIFIGLAQIPGFQNRSSRHFLITLFPALCLTFLLFILIDNFTYTVFNFGVISIRENGRTLFGLFFIGLFIFVFKYFFPNIQATNIKKQKIQTLILLSLALISILACAVKWSSEWGKIQKPSYSQRLLANPPDIYFISADSMEVTYWNLYGFKGKETTSFFSSFNNEAVVFQNFFTNINRTSGSLASVLTGKYGTTTHKLHSGHIFKGIDSYEHLPAILKSAGYSTLQCGWKHHTDANHWNMRDGFDVINTRKRLFPIGFLNGHYALELQFIQTIVDRLLERLQHSFGFELMADIPHRNTNQQPLTDDQREKTLFDFIKKHSGPIFAQIHFDWVVTPKQAQKFDQRMKEIVAFLKANHKFDNAMIVFYSDHGTRYRTDRRLPLIIKFPKQKSFQGNPNINTQNIDLAPTALDLIGIQKPDWMEGMSLLSNVDPYRPIYSVWSIWSSHGIPLIGEPQTQLGGPEKVSVIFCNKIFTLDLENMNLTSANIPNYQTVCDSHKIPLESDVKKILIDHLQRRGYDVIL